MLKFAALQECACGAATANSPDGQSRPGVYHAHRTNYDFPEHLFRQPVAGLKRMQQRSLIRYALAAAPAIVVAVIGALVLQMASSSMEAVRLRNSLIFEAVDVASLNWNPPDYPASFKLNRHEAPAAYQDAIAAIAGQRVAERPRFGDAVALGKHLAVEGFKGGRIQSDAVTNLEGIVERGAGYCADFAQVFNGLAHTLSLPVREWGMSFGGFNGDGHSFNEVFDFANDRWVFIDSYFSFYVTDRLSGDPLSVIEFRDRLRREGGRNSIAVVPISEERFLFGSHDIALNYYQRGVDEYYMWWGNNVFDYDQSLPVSLAGKVSRTLEQVVAIIAGVHPGIRIPRVPENATAIAELERVRARLLILFSVGTVSTLLLAWQCIAVLRRRRQRAGAAITARA